MQFSNDCCKWLFYIVSPFFHNLWKAPVKEFNFSKIADCNIQILLKNEPLYMYFATAAFSFLLSHFAYYNCTPHFCRGAREGRLSVQPNFEKEAGLTGPQPLKGGCWERVACFFQGGCNCHIKNKLKSEIFNDKKSL